MPLKLELGPKMPVKMTVTSQWKVLLKLQKIIPLLFYYDNMDVFIQGII